MKMLAAFHFLRPEWLLLLVPLVGLWWLIRFRDQSSVRRQVSIADHLLQALTINRSSARRYLPADGVAIAMLFCTLAVAGPSFRQQQSPWFSETVPLVIALEVSDSMRAIDLPPNRLERARFKIQDLIAARTGARTALIAYGGSAHIVMPPTSDEQVLKPFLESLDPAIMPRAGANLSNVLPLASELLLEESQRGTVLVVADNIASADVPALRAFTEREGAPQLVLLLTATGNDAVALMPDGSLARNADGSAVDASVDLRRISQIGSEVGMAVVTLSENGDSDIFWLLNEISSSLSESEDPDAVWVDDAWWLLWPAIFLMLFWFRRGWSMQW